MPLPRLRPASLVGLCLLWLAACEPAPEPVAPEPVPVPTPAPEPKPAPRPETVPAPRPPEPSEESRLLAEYYRRVQSALLSQGLMRGDADAVDAPFTDTMLARDFVEIALFDEYAGGSLSAGRAESVLRRWEGPIRLGIEFGPSVPAEQRARDRADVSAYAARLSRLTGVPITPAESGANLRVAILSEDEREAFAPTLRDWLPGVSDAFVRSFVNLPKDNYCVVIVTSGGPGGSYDGAVVLIRAELPPLLRTQCIHEELAQGMGLPNDSRQARPTIFSDNDEFGRLTRHDELLLRMLYDPRLRVGMTVDEARPIVARIATELVEGGQS